MDYLALQDDVRDVCGRVADMLRAARADQAVAGLDWSVSELGAHLVTVASRNISAARREPVSWEREASSHATIAAVNEEEIAALAEREPAKLADLLEVEGQTLLDVYGPDPHRPVRWLDYDTHADSSTAVWLAELLVHGLDLARTLKRDWALRPEQALVIFEGLLPALPAFVSREGARRAAGVYHVHLRGGGDYTLDVRADGTMSAGHGRPAKADLHVSADPVAYLLVGYGRTGQWSAIARGAIVAWGRKPWLALRFADLFERP